MTSLKPTIIFLFLFISFLSNAQVSGTDENNNIIEEPKNEITETIEPEKYWTKTGKINLLFSQASFDNWQAGGQDNLAANLGLNYDFNYKKNKLTWDNKLTFLYGVAKVESNDLQKTNDRLEFNSLVGRELKNDFYFTYFVNVRTQIDKGIDLNTGETVTEFFSPAFIQTGPGLQWRKSDNLKINLAPAAAKFVIVNGKFTEVETSQVQAFNDAGGYFGVEANEILRFELGAALAAYYKFKLVENVFLENILNLYSNYLEDAQNVDIDYTLNIDMKINEYLSSNFSFQTIYDDNAFEGFQTRQVFGLGVNVDF